MHYTIIDNIWNGWAGVVNSDGKFITLSASVASAEQFILTITEVQL